MKEIICRAYIISAGSAPEGFEWRVHWDLTAMFHCNLSRFAPDSGIGRWGGARDAHPLLVQFLLLSCSFGGKLAFHTHLWSCPHLENP